MTLVLGPLDDPAPGLFRGNRHVVWVIPVVNPATFATVGLGLGWLARWRPGGP